MLTGVAMVKTAAAERDLRWRWEDLQYTEMFNFAVKKLSNGLDVASAALINTCGRTLLLWYGAMLVIQEHHHRSVCRFQYADRQCHCATLALAGLWYEARSLISVERLDGFQLSRKKAPENPC